MNGNFIRTDDISLVKNSETDGKEKLTDSTEGVYRERVQLFNNDGNPVGTIIVISKTPRYSYRENKSESLVKDYMANYSDCLANGIPVIPFLIENSEEIFMPDMAINGGLFIDKEFYLELSELVESCNIEAIQEMILKNSQMLEAYLSIPFLEIEQEARRIAEVAGKAGYVLPIDDQLSYIQISQNSWYMCVADLSWLSKARHDALPINYKLVQEFLEWHSFIRNTIQHYRNLGFQLTPMPS